MNSQQRTTIHRITQGLEALLWVAGLTLVADIGLAVFGMVSHGPDYYVNFALGVVLMAGLLALIDLGDKYTGVRRVVTDADIEEGAAPAPPKPGWGLFKAAIIVVATVCGLIGLGYFRIHIHDLVVNAPFFSSTDVNMGYLIIFSIVILTWLHWGWLLATISASAIAYFFFGDLIPVALLRHPTYDIPFIMNYVALNTNQGFFEFSAVAADQIYLLTYFGVTLLGVGMLRMMVEVGRAAGTRVKGGAALPAVLGSSAVGAVMGQAVSNVVLTGRLTIPMMKKYGYQPAMAGAIEATASSVGQIMPPVLGLAAFLIASFLGMPYVTVAMAAVIPAALYIFGVAASIVVYALREDLPRLEEAVETRLIWRMLPTLVIPLTLVVWLLLGYRAAGFAGLVGMVAALVLAAFQGPYRPRWAELKSALREGMVLTTILSLLILAIGPLGQAMVTTNLSGRLATLLATVLPHVELLLLGGAMVLCILLGMGLPTPIAYVVASLSMVPFLQEVGVPAFQSHFFVFYFAVFSTLTPPVAVSVLAASKLADASFKETALNAMKIAGTTFIIPFAFIYNPKLLGFPNIDATVIMPIIEVLATQVAFSIMAYGYCFKRLGRWERVLFGVIALLGYWTLTTYGRPVVRDVILIVTLIAMIGWSWLSARAARKANDAQSGDAGSGGTSRAETAKRAGY